MDHHKQTYKLTDCSSQANHPLAHQHETHEIAHTDPFGKDLMKPMDEFSHKHKDMHHRGVEGTYISHTTFSSTVVGPDGKAHKEMYMEDSAGLHKGGQTISQTQQMYKNTEGVNKIAEERMLNEQGRKIVKSKEGEEVHETEHYHNVEPEHKEEFDKKWEGMDKETKFVENSQKEMKKLGAHGHGQKAIQTNEHPNKC